MSTAAMTGVTTGNNGGNDNPVTSSYVEKQFATKDEISTIIGNNNGKNADVVVRSTNATNFASTTRTKNIIFFPARTADSYVKQTKYGLGLLQGI